MTKQITFLIIFFSSITLVFGQEALPIKLINPSFEGMARLGKGPNGWIDCGFPNESAPDVHPVFLEPPYGFSVVRAAFSGNTYLGMVVRDNDTWEAVSQNLRQPLKGGKCYRFATHLAMSSTYLSKSRVDDRSANYTTPATLRIWAGDSPCGKKELLHTTRAVINTRWVEYEMEFRPKKDYQYIVLEAYYRTPVLFPYNGHVLVDNMQDIVPFPCDEEFEEAPIAEEEISGADELVVIKPLDEPFTESNTPPAPSPAPKTPEVKKEEVAASPAVAQNTPSTPTPAPAPKKETKPAPKKPETNESGLATLDTKSLREGSIIRVKKLYFSADKSDVRSDSRGVLDEIYTFLKKNDSVIVEIGGHTNGTPSHVYCDSLSTLRAKTVANHLTTKGIPEERVKYKGYGKRKPLMSNRTAEGRRRNQRVEIKVLGFKD